MNKQNALKGIVWSIIFSFTAVLSDVIVRYVTLQGFPSSQVLFIRCFLGTWILLPFVLKNRVFGTITRKTLQLYITRGVLACIAVGTWFYILQYTDFTALMTVGCAAPLFTTILSIMFLGEKATFIKTCALIVGFIGALIVINPIGVMFNWYLLLGLLSSFIWATSIIITKQLSNKEHPVTIAFFLVLVLTPLSFLLSIATWQWPSFEQWGLILLFTAIATISQISLAKAFSYADLTTLMPFEFSQLIFAALFSYMVFGDLVTLNTAIGGIIIFGSGYIIVRTQRKKHKAEELQIIP